MVTSEKEKGKRDQLFLLSGIDSKLTQRLF